MAAEDCAHCQNALKKAGTRGHSGGCEWHVFKRADGKFAWHLIADNGSDIIATDGGQGYDRADEAAEMMKRTRSGHYSGCPMEPH